MRHTTEATIGEHRGRPRVYLGGKWLLESGFRPGEKISADFDDGELVLRVDADGDRKVSQKKGDVPVIDLNTNKLREVFGDVRRVIVRSGDRELVIRASRIEKKKATRVRNGREGSLFAGGGLMTEAARQAGFDPTFAIEISEKYADIFEGNHGGKMMNVPIEEIELEDLEPVELLTIGLPCEPFSRARDAQRGAGNICEDHALGDMVFWALRIIDNLNPATVVIEEAPAFLKSGAGQIAIRALERLGYAVSSKIVNPLEHGELSGRKRAVIIASDEPTQWLELEECQRTVGEILDESVEPGAWFDRETKSWLFNHWEKQSAKGNGFGLRARKLKASDTNVGTIKKRYFNGQGDGQVVTHPKKEGVFRWLTLREVKRLHGVAGDYYLGAAKTTAGEVLGQGVIVSLFARLIGEACS